MKQKLLLALVTIMLVAACKKDKKDISLLGKWTLENTISKEYNNGVMVSQDTEPGDGTIVDFQGNGKVIATDKQGNVDAGTYAIKPDSKVEIDGDLFDMQNLTASNVTLYRKESFTASYYIEIIITLKR
jgi:hypothetical protein